MKRLFGVVLIVFFSRNSKGMVLVSIPTPIVTIVGA